MQKPPCGGFCAQSLTRSCRVGQAGRLRIFKHELTARSISRAFPNNDLAVLNAEHRRAKTSECARTGSSFWGRRFLTLTRLASIASLEIRCRSTDRSRVNNQVGASRGNPAAQLVWRPPHRHPGASYRRRNVGSPARLRERNLRQLEPPSGKRFHAPVWRDLLPTTARTSSQYNATRHCYH